MTQVEARLIALHPVVREDHVRIAFWHRIGKGFLIGEQFGALHIAKQRAQQNIRGLNGIFRLILRHRGMRTEK